MPLMLRKVSCCPANDASGRSSAVALERTAQETAPGSRVVVHERRIGGADVRLHLGREGLLLDPLADVRADAGEIGDVADVKRLDHGLDPVVEAVRGEELAIGICRCREAARNA